MNTMRNRGQKRIALRPLTHNELNQRTQITKSMAFKRRLFRNTNGRNLVHSIKTLQSSWDGDTKMSDSESDDLFAVDIDDEPPIKKRRTSLTMNRKVNSKQKLILSPIPPPTPNVEKHDENRYIDVMDKGTPIRSAVDSKMMRHSDGNLYSNGNITDLLKASKSNTATTSRVPILDRSNAVISNLKKTNTELTEQVVKYRENCKAYYRKCKALKHCKATMKETIKALSARDQRMKKERDRMEQKVAELESTLKALKALKSMKTMNADHDLEEKYQNKGVDKHEILGKQPIEYYMQQITVLKQKMKDIEYECNGWKLKYNKLLQDTNEFGSANTRMASLQKEILRSKTLYEMDKNALESDRTKLRAKYMELVEKAKSDYDKMKRLKLQTKTACAQLKMTQIEMERTTQKMVDYTSIKEELDRLRQDTISQKTQIQELKDKQAECDEQHVDRSQLESAKKALSATNQKYIKCTSTLKNLNQRIKELLNDIDDLNQKLHRKGTEIEGLQNRNDSLCRDIKDVEQRLENINDQLHDAQSNQISFELERESWNRKIRRKCTQIEELQTQVERARTKAKVWKFQLKVLAKQQRNRLSQSNQWLMQCKQDEIVPVKSKRQIHMDIEEDRNKTKESLESTHSVYRISEIGDHDKIDNADLDGTPTRLDHVVSLRTP